MDRSRPSVSLEPDRATREEWLRVFGELAQDAVDERTEGRSSGVLGAAALDLAEELSGVLGDDPLPGGARAVAEHVRRAASAGLRPAHAGYFAYVPGAGLFASALADLVAGSLNRFTGLTAASPALARMEADVIAWLARECGYDDRAGGLLLSGGSLANLSAVITAREERLDTPGDYRNAIAYASSQAHHCVAKAFRLAGIPVANVRTIGVDEQFRMRADELAQRVSRDRAAGCRPFLVVASAGTTNTGALDPLGAVADVAAEHGLWFHVDGAYGGAFVMTKIGRPLLADMARADSIALDPHKGFFLPFGTGCLLVRDGLALRRAHSAGADYLRDFDALERTREAPSPTDHGPELSRSFRGLRLWMPLALHGARAFRHALTEKLSLAQIAHDGVIRRIDEGAPLEVVAAPQLSTFAFRWTRGASETVDRWNERNHALVGAINAAGTVHLSSTLLPVQNESEPVVTLRVCVLGTATHRDHVDAFLESLDAALDT